MVHLERGQGEDLETILGPQEATQQQLVEIFPEPAATIIIIKKNIFQNSSPVSHPVVDDRVDGTVGHGQPVEAQVDVLDVGERHDGGLVVGVEEVDVVGQPADSEHRDDHHEHLDDPPLVLPALDGALSKFPWGVSPQVLT